MKMAFEEIENHRAMARNSDSSDFSDHSDGENGPDKDLENSQGKNKKSPHKRRGRNKGRYVCKFSACGQKVKVDNCLCARLILAGFLLSIIISVFFCIYWAEQDIEARKAAEKLAA